MVIKITSVGEKREMFSSSSDLLVMHLGIEQNFFDVGTDFITGNGKAKGANDFNFEFEPFINKLG